MNSTICFHRRFIFRATAFVILPAMFSWAAVPSSAQKKTTAGSRISHTERVHAEAGIRNTLNEQAAAWNRGDVDAFVTGYYDSDETLYIGKQVEHGYAAIAARYKTAYPTSEKMGKLAFTDLEVHQLDQDYAAVVGKYHLERTPAAGGNAEGIFSLILENTAQGWKIVLDHTS